MLYGLLGLMSRSFNVFPSLTRVTTEHELNLADSKDGPMLRGDLSCLLDSLALIRTQPGAA
jgi:hypothetical protein